MDYVFTCSSFHPLPLSMSSVYLQFPWEKLLARQVHMFSPYSECKGFSSMKVKALIYTTSNRDLQKKKQRLLSLSTKDANPKGINVVVVLK